MKQKKLLALAALVAVLFAVYLGLRVLAAQQDSAQAASKSVGAVHGSVTQMTASYGNGWTLVQASGTWQWADDAAFPLMQTVPEAMAAMGAGVPVTGQVLADVGSVSLAEYGLDAPKNSITLKTDADEAVTLNFGNENTHTGETYLTVSGDSALYTVATSTVQAFAYDLYDMIMLEQWPVTSATQIGSVSIAQNGATQSLRLDVSNTDAGETSYTVTENGVAHAANTDMAMALLEEVAALSVTGCVAYRAEATTLAQYGLAEPAATIVVTWLDAQQDHQSVTLYVGMGEDATVYYTQTQGSTAVNTMDGAAVASILNTTATNLQAVPAA